MELALKERRAVVGAAKARGPADFCGVSSGFASAASDTKLEDSRLVIVNVEREFIGGNLTGTRNSTPQVW
jgi:hypothetical protein